MGWLFLKPMTLAAPPSCQPTLAKFELSMGAVAAFVVVLGVVNFLGNRQRQDHEALVGLMILRHRYRRAVLLNESGKPGRL